MLSATPVRDSALLGSLSCRMFLRRQYPLAVPWRLPQCVCREEGGEHRGHAQREHCPYEEEGLGGLADIAAENAVGSLHVENRDEQAKERPEENDDVSRPPFGEHQRSVEPDDQNEHRKQTLEPRRRHPEEDIVGQVKRYEKDGKEGRDRQHDALFHVRLAFLRFLSARRNDPTTRDLGL